MNPIITLIFAIVYLAILSWSIYRIVKKRKEQKAKHSMDIKNKGG